MAAEEKISRQQLFGEECRPDPADFLKAGGLLRPGISGLRYISLLFEHAVIISRDYSRSE